MPSPSSSSSRYQLLQPSPYPSQLQSRKTHKIHHHNSNPYNDQNLEKQGYAVSSRNPNIQTRHTQINNNHIQIRNIHIQETLTHLHSSGQELALGLFGLRSHNWQSSLTKAIDEEGSQSSDFGEREFEPLDSADDDAVQGKAQALFTKQGVLELKSSDQQSSETGDDGSPSNQMQSLCSTTAIVDDGGMAGCDLQAASMAEASRSTHFLHTYDSEEGILKRGLGQDQSQQGVDPKHNQEEIGHFCLCNPL